MDSRSFFVAVFVLFLALGCRSDSTDSLDTSRDSLSDGGDLASVDSVVPDLPLDRTTEQTARDGTSELDTGPDETGVPDSLEETADLVPLEPTFWSQEATTTIDDLEFVTVGGERFFALGFHTSDGLVWDGVAGPGECDKNTGNGWLDINVEKTHAAAAAGANLVYLWGYEDGTAELIDVIPRFKGGFHDGYGQILSTVDDVVPVFLNRYGEVDMDGYSEAKANEMREEFSHFMNRTGPYSLEAKPNLPPVEQVGHMAWHPTFRMGGTGDGTGEILTHEQATDLARTTNMMIGDAYTYVENRFDWNIAGEAIMAIAVGQKGEKGEDYDYWLETDDPDHRSFFSSGWDLSYSLTTKRNPGSVVWMWLQGYAFGDSIARGICEGKTVDDSWATGGFPPLNYLAKEILSTIVAGSTGFIYFGFNSTRWPEANIMISTFRALAHPEVYGPALLSPRLDLGFDTRFLGEEGYDGKGRAHVMVKWHAPTKTAYVLGANPGARGTRVEIPFPWSLDRVEVLDWESPGFVTAKYVQVQDKVLVYEFPRDSGVLLRVWPLMPPD
jgi:hypothetical protein